jgi:hypothetical protein
MPNKKDNIEVEAKVYLSFGPGVSRKKAQEHMENLLCWLHNEMANGGEDILETDVGFSFSCDETPAFKVTKY